MTVRRLGALAALTAIVASFVAWLGLATASVSAVEWNSPSPTTLVEWN